MIAFGIIALKCIVIFLMTVCIFALGGHAYKKYGEQMAIFRTHIEFPYATLLVPFAVIIAVAIL